MNCVLCVFVFLFFVLVVFICVFFAFVLCAFGFLLTRDFCDPQTQMN